MSVSPHADDWVIGPWVGGWVVGQVHDRAVTSWGGRDGQARGRSTSPARRGVAQPQNVLRVFAGVVRASSGALMFRRFLAATGRGVTQATAA